MAETHDLSKILDAQIPIIAIESADELRVRALMLRFAMKRNLSFYEWSITQGLRPGGFSERLRDAAQYDDPEAVLAHIAETPGPSLYVLCDFHPFLKGEPKNIRYLKEIGMEFSHLHNTVVLVSHALDVPADIGRMTATLELHLPSDAELTAMVKQHAEQWARSNKGKRVRTDSRTLERLIANLRGVSHADANLLIRHTIYDDGAITESDIPAINKLKFDLLDSEGVLRYEYDTQSFADVAGLANLKQWLKLRRSAFVEAGTDRPRGVLLLGVQGGGKSLAAKAIAGFWGIPLLRIDFGTLYNKYHGETERNLRNSLKQAEMMAPCVLWMDEIEKGVSTGGSDNATATRVLGTLLTWMAENRAPVFIVATANDIASLPPELIRKGRLDEIFFVDLPDTGTRKEIFRIHLAKRDLEPMLFDLDGLAARTEGFTGAEIEEAIVAARYMAAAGGSRVQQAQVESSVDRTYPMSVLRAESMAQLREWARERTVPA